MKVFVLVCREAAGHEKQISSSLKQTGTETSRQSDYYSSDTWHEIKHSNIFLIRETFLTESGPAARRLTRVEEQLRLLYFYLRDSCFTSSEVKDRAPWLSQNPVSSRSQPSHTHTRRGHDQHGWVFPFSRPFPIVSICSFFKSFITQSCLERPGDLIHKSKSAYESLSSHSPAEVQDMSLPKT